MTTEFETCANMEELVGYRHEETKPAAQPARKKFDPSYISEYRKSQIRQLVFDTIAENGGHDWNHDPIDIETVGVLLDEQHEAEEQWLADNWEALEEEAYQKIEREHEHERNQREESVPRWGR